MSLINVRLDTAEDADAHQAWTESLWQSIRNEGSGIYVNFLESEGIDRIREANSGTTYERLSAIKQTYGAGNLFRFNQYMPPRS